MHIKELTLYTGSLSRTRLFYHKTLELEIISENENSISFKAGSSALTFRQAAAGRPFYHIAFNIAGHRFAECFERMNNKLDLLPVDGANLIAQYDEWNAQSFYFHDNNGSILEFIVRHDLSYPGSLSADCVEEISETGIVVDDVPETARLLNSRYGVPYFVKGPRLGDFVAMGDEHGLLLVCAYKRGWVPTHKPAQKFPLVLRDDNGKTIRLGANGLSAEDIQSP